MLLIILLILPSVLSLSLTGVVRYYALNSAIVDIPNDRSSHSQPTPRGGGVGFIIAFAAITLSTPIFSSYFPQFFPENLFPASQPYLLQLWAILTPLALIGFLDDKHDLPAHIRYLVQLTVGGIALFCFGPFPQPWLTQFGLPGQILVYSLTLIAITALINFYNFMDGLDGLVAGVTAVQLGFLALYLHQPLWWLLVAALLGFLWWNWSPAKIFMGDVGSTVLGAAVAIALLNEDNAIPAWNSLAITLPLTADAIYTLTRRFIRRENIFKAHRSHLYQRLQQAGWSHSQVASTYIGCTLLIALSILLWGSVGAWFGLALVGVGMVGGGLYLGKR